MYNISCSTTRICSDCVLCRSSGRYKIRRSYSCSKSLTKSDEPRRRRSAFITNGYVLRRYGRFQIRSPRYLFSIGLKAPIATAEALYGSEGNENVVLRDRNEFHATERVCPLQTIPSESAISICSRRISTTSERCRQSGSTGII